MSNFEKKKQAYLKKLEKNKDKISKFVSNENDDKFKELINLVPKDEEELRQAAIVLNFIIDIIDVLDDVENEKIADDEFYNNKANKYIIRYINAKKEGKDTDKILEELSDPEEAAEVLYGSFKSLASLDKTCIYIRLKTGFDYDEKNTNEEKFLESYMEAYKAIYNSTVLGKNKKQNDEDCLVFCEKFHGLYRIEKMATELAEGIFNMAESMQEEIKAVAKIEEERKRQQQEQEEFEKEKNILKIVKQSLKDEEKERLEEMGFVFTDSKFDGLYNTNLPECWKLGGKDSHLRSVILNEKDNIVGSLDYCYKNGCIECARIKMQPYIKISKNEFVNKNEQELTDMGFNFIGIPNTDSCAVELPEGWTTEKIDKLEAFTILDDNGNERGHFHYLANDKKYLMRIYRYYDICTVSEDLSVCGIDCKRISIYFGNKDEKLYGEQYVTTPGKSVECEDYEDKVISWADKNYPDWRKFDTYWYKAKENQYKKNIRKSDEEDK